MKAKIGISKNSVRKIIHLFPMQVQREILRFNLEYCHPKKFKYFEEIRHVETSEGYTLKSFDEFKCIFVHIPKCAGISVSKSLFGNLGGNHIGIRTYQLIFSPEEFDQYFKFAFVRNPWDRVVSAYFFLKKGGISLEDKQWAEDNLKHYSDFEEFVKGWVNEENVSRSKHFRPQWEFICAPNGRTLVDFVGRFENIKRDFEYINKQLEIKQSLMDLNINRKKRDYKSFFTPETRRIVAKTYQRDIALFNYSFDE